MDNKGKFVINNGSTIILDAPYMELYIPVDWLSNGLAVDAGTYIETLGLVYMKIFDSNEKILSQGILKMPTTINIYPDETERKTIKLNDNEEKVLVCKFFKGSSITDSKIKQSSDNAEKFLNLLIRGSIPKIVPYDEILSLCNKNLSMNGVALGVPSFIKEIIIREVYRNPAKKEETFSVVAGQGKAKMTDYATSNMREICAQNSTFAAITYEDMDSMLITSLNRSKLKKAQVESPLERIIKY